MLKHVGRMANNKRKVVVAYKVIPGDTDSCIVVTTENLMAEEHDALIRLVESTAGQQAEDLATVMGRTPLPDGRNMLSSFHHTGKMVKVPTNTVEMTPDTKQHIMLHELNQLIAEQRGVTLEELAMADPNPKKPEAKAAETDATETPAPAPEATAEPTPVPPADAGVLSDEQLAAQYRSQASTMYKEAKRLREQAEELAPTPKKKAAAPKATKATKSRA